MSAEFAGASYTLGQANAIIKLLKKQAGEDGPERFLRGEITVAEPASAWREQDGVIYFTVTSDGKSGSEWIAHFKKKGDRVSGYAKQLVCHRDFVPTKGVTYQVAVLKGTFFSDKDRVTKKIRSEADRRKFSKPNAEIACLIRDKLTDAQIEAMGLIWIVTMHEPTKDSGGSPRLLAAHRDDFGRWLGACYDSPGYQWGREDGFAFVVSQVSAGA